MRAQTHARRDPDGVVVPGLEHLAGLVELDDGPGPAVSHPDVALPVDVNPGPLAQVVALGQRGPVRNQVIRKLPAGFELHQPLGQLRRGRGRGALLLAEGLGRERRPESKRDPGKSSSHGVPSC